MLKFLAAGDGRVATRVKANAGSVYLGTVAAEESLTIPMNMMNRARAPRSGLSLPRAHDDFSEAIDDLLLLPRFSYSPEAEAVFQTFSPRIIRIGPQDCRIAAQAIAHGMTVITRNRRDFDAIGARYADWSE